MTKQVGNKIVELQDDERIECEVWTRVMGYYRPISEFNIGKKQEQKERFLYGESDFEERKLEAG